MKIFSRGVGTQKIACFITLLATHRKANQFPSGNTNCYLDNVVSGGILKGERLFQPM
jgi:hypothetical protein